MVNKGRGDGRALSTEAAARRLPGRSRLSLRPHPRTARYGRSPATRTSHKRSVSESPWTIRIEGSAAAVTAVAPGETARPWSARCVAGCVVGWWRVLCGKLEYFLLFLDKNLMIMVRF